MNHITLYCAQKSNRLLFVLDWFLHEQLKLDYTIVHDEAELKQLPFFISYGKTFHNALSIPDTGLLWEKGCREHEVKVGNWNRIPTLYQVNDSAHLLPFDMLSGIFFLLSRYEEYYPYKPDQHGRYPATQSILYKNNLLQRPLVDEWVQAFRVLLTEQFEIQIPEVSFSYQPTYDIDIAYSYKYKGFVRSAGAYFRDLWHRNKETNRERMSVWLGKIPDPFDSYEWLKQIHANNAIQPVYFILACEKTTDFDKNISPRHHKMQKLVNQLAEKGEIGLHPSYYSDSGDTLKEEKEILEKVCHRRVFFSRQHYIKMKIPDTYLQLMKTGISQDYSMGYGSHLGFRAGTGQTFHWYALQNEFTTPLLLHPFCFMDTAAMYGEKLSMTESFERLREMAKRLQKANSRLVTIFHNFSLGTLAEWRWWKGSYKAFLEEFYK